MHTALASQPSTPDPVIVIVIDRQPPRRTGFALTVGHGYAAEVVRPDVRLFAISDDLGQRMLVSLFGRTLTNGGYWHLQHDEAAIATHCN